MNSFPVAWIHGSASCSANEDPPLQVHAFDPQTFILRQNKCHNYEGPFLYLLIGSEQALLLDTGAKPGPGHFLPIGSVVNGLLPPALHLIVAHSHGHGDHAFGDGQFAGRPNTTVVPPNLVAVRNFFGLPDWPNGTATVDLGDRPLSILPIPGHEPSHVAIHDEQRGLLLTGDTLYPGLLVINDWQAYRASAARLRSFAEGKTVSHVLGAHVEMKRTPRELYPIGTTFQPEEHVLPLTRSHLEVWSDEVAALGNDPHMVVLDDFILGPAST